MKINFIIDALLFLVIMAISGIGLLLKFVLVHGSRRWEIYGGNVDLYLWGWDRHQWGALHFLLGYIFLGLLVLHIVFHWNQIKCMFCSLICNKALRMILILVFIPASIALLLFAFILDHEIVYPKSVEKGRRIERSRQRIEESNAIGREKDLPDAATEETIYERDRIQQEGSVRVYGSMTLRDVGNLYNVPADSIKKFLGIPSRISDDEKLGRLRKIYDFHMSEIQQFIDDYR